MSKSVFYLILILLGVVTTYLNYIVCLMNLTLAAEIVSITPFFEAVLIGFLLTTVKDDE